MLKIGDYFKLKVCTSIKINTNGSGIYDRFCGGDMIFLIHRITSKTLYCSCVNHENFSKKFKGFQIPVTTEVLQIKSSTIPKSILLEPIQYKIDIISIDKEIPIEEEISFIQWLSDRVHYCSLGQNLEYYSYRENPSDDIAVTFKISIR